LTRIDGGTQAVGLEITPVDLPPEIVAILASISTAGFSVPEIVLICSETPCFVGFHRFLR
jgi:hypothetical protein